METIVNWGGKELRIATELDYDKELEIDISVDEKNEPIWLTKEDIKKVIEHLQEIYYKIK